MAVGRRYVAGCQSTATCLATLPGARRPPTRRPATGRTRESPCSARPSAATDARDGAEILARTGAGGTSLRSAGPAAQAPGCCRWTPGHRNLKAAKVGQHCCRLCVMALSIAALRFGTSRLGLLGNGCARCRQVPAPKRTSRTQALAEVCYCLSACLATLHRSSTGSPCAVCVCKQPRARPAR